MEVTTFASGSAGNCALLSGEHTHLLIDAGISFLKIRKFLEQRGILPADLAGVLITHEHQDHVKGVKTLLKRTEVPLYAPPVVAERLAESLPESRDRICAIPVSEPFAVGDLQVTAFATPHDTPQSVGYRVEDGESAFSLCTDLGYVTDEVLDHLLDCDAAVIEANHDVQMLRDGPYPYALKRRILSDHGHLSNDACGALAVTMADHGTRQLILGHISRENNTPDKALETVSRALRQAGFGGVTLAAAPMEGCLTVSVKGGSPCSQSN